MAAIASGVVHRVYLEKEICYYKRYYTCIIFFKNENTINDSHIGSMEDTVEQKNQLNGGWQKEIYTIR